MSARVIPTNEELNGDWLRLGKDLTLIASYKKPPIRNTPAEISSSQKARVIPIKEEKTMQSLRTKFSPPTSRANKALKSTTYAELVLSQQNMEKEIERENERQNEIRREEARKRIAMILKQNKAKNYIRNLLRKNKAFIPEPVKKIITDVAKKAKEKVFNFLSHQPTKLEELGQSPPNSKGGYNYRKYKYTNITKKPAKPKIFTKKPKKQQIFTKKPKK